MGLCENPLAFTSVLVGYFVVGNLGVRKTAQALRKTPRKLKSSCPRQLRHIVQVFLKQ